MKLTPGSVAAITGAASGIGEALALDLAGRGVRVALSDVDATGLERVTAACNARGADAKGYRLDVADREAVLAHAADVVADFGAVNLVVNNAGVALTASIQDMPHSDLEWVMNIDFYGVTHGVEAFLPHLIASGRGHVVNISSVFGLFAVPSQAAYNAAKFAVRGYTEALRMEMRLSGHPVGVSCVHPGGIRTAIAANSRSLPGADRQEMTAMFDKLARTSPAKAAQVILRGVERDKARVLIGADAHAFSLMTRTLGAGYQPLVAAATRKSLASLAGITRR